MDGADVFALRRRRRLTSFLRCAPKCNFTARGFRYLRLPGRSMAVLQVLKGMTPGQVFALSGERMILGRHPECDIVLDVGAVSRQHAVVVRMNNEFYVEDL